MCRLRTTWLYRETDVFDSVTTGPWQPHLPATPFWGAAGCAVTVAGRGSTRPGAESRRRLYLGNDHRRSGRARVAHRLFRHLEIVVETPMGPKPELAENGMIRLDRVDGADLALDDQPQEMNESQLVLGVVDLAAVQGDLGPVFLGIVQELEGVARGAGRTAEDADDQVRVEPDQFFHGLGTVIDHLEEEGSAGWSDARQHPRDHVVDVAGQELGRDRRRECWGQKPRGNSGNPSVRPLRESRGIARGSPGRVPGCC